MKGGREKERVCGQREVRNLGPAERRMRSRQVATLSRTAYFLLILYLAKTSGGDSIWDGLFLPGLHLISCTAPPTALCVYSLLSAPVSPRGRGTNPDASQPKTHPLFIRGTNIEIAAFQFTSSQRLRMHGGGGKKKILLRAEENIWIYICFLEENTR